jgi:hypothetical protein
MPRTRKTEAVIPTTSLVASAVRYSGKAARIYRPNQEWQKECYRHYEICGEARFAANFYGHAMSRARLYVAQRGTTDKVDRIEDGPAFEVLADLFNGKDGQAQMLKALGIHLTVAGECYLVGRTVNGQDAWEIVSILEMKVSGDKWTIVYGDGMADVKLTDEDVVIRIWNPNPARRIEADSPFRSLLPVLTEIEWATRNIFAQTSSRLAGAGILFMPQGMSFPKPPPQEGQEQTTSEDESEASLFMRTLADAMLTPIEDPSSPSAMIPVVVTAPDDAIDKAKLMHFWSNLDEKVLEMRASAINRFADGMDLPREQIMGMSSNNGTGGGTSNGVSHWGAWQVEESTIKMFLEPMLELVCNALTVGYLRPLLEDGDGGDEETGLPAPTRVEEFIHYDTSALRLRPDRSEEAISLWDRGLLKTSTLLRETGFDVSDMPDDTEFKTWLLRKIASGSNTPEQVAAAARALGVDLPSDTNPAAQPNEAPPPPSLEDHPSRPRTPGEDRPLPAPDAAAAAVLAASDALVWRALERAGNRIRQNAGIKPPGVPSYEMHTLVQVNGTADSVLNDAWSCAPQVLEGICDVDTTVQSLNSYVRALFAEQAPHTRDRLARWLEASR